MRIVFFGTYDSRRHPRVGVLEEGFAAHGDEVLECNVPLGLETAWRVRILRRPWLLPLLAMRVASAWWRLWRRSRRLPPADAVAVGYMGHFDVHLARRLWPRTPLVLDHLVSAADTAADRRVSSPRVLGLLERLDRAAVGAADVPCVDTEEQLELLPAEARPRALVVRVGAPDRWFRAPERSEGPPLRVVFFGLYTPLQGAPFIGRAIALLADEEASTAFTMIGRGQDFEATRASAAAHRGVVWRHWVDPDELPGLVARHDVCLGIFGRSPKALRVVPNKVFQGAAAGCAIVTSDTPPQRAALGDAAIFVPPGDAGALAEALRGLAADPARVWEVRRAAHERAEAAFRPGVIVRPLRERLLA